MDRRNTIQKDLVLDAVIKMHRHVTADEVYETISSEYSSIGKATVYRNLNVLAAEGKISKLETPEGPGRFDYRTEKHYHVKCAVCGSICDVDKELLPEIDSTVPESSGYVLLDHEIFFKGICPLCLDKQRKANAPSE